MKTKEYLWGLICRLVHTVREEWSQEGEFIVPVEDDLTVNEGYRLLEMVDDAIGVTEKAWELGIINKETFIVEFAGIHIVKRSVLENFAKKVGAIFNEHV